MRSFVWGIIVGGGLLTPGVFGYFLERTYDESYHRDAVKRVFTGGLLASSITLAAVPGRPAQEPAP